MSKKQAKNKSRLFGAPRRRSARTRSKYHFYRNCPICGKRNFGTVISLDEHEQNCSKAKYAGISMKNKS